MRRNESGMRYSAVQPSGVRVQTGRTFPVRTCGKAGRARAGRAEAQLPACVGVDLKVYITSVIREREEKFHAAVLMDGAERGAALRSDVRFPCVLENIEHGIVVAELLLHADAAVRLPQHAVRAQRLDRVPAGAPDAFAIV